MRKPRPFSHKPIYVDARQEHLKAVEQRARQELGLTTATTSQPAKLYGAFSGVRHSRHGGISSLSIPMLLSVILSLLFAFAVIVFS